jgi:hypothetical protein
MELAHRLERSVSVFISESLVLNDICISTSYRTHYLLLISDAILSRHLENNSRLVVVKNAGHAANLEKSKEVCRNIVEYLQEPVSVASTGEKVVQ